MAHGSFSLCLFLERPQNLRTVLQVLHICTAGVPRTDMAKPDRTKETGSYHNVSTSTTCRLNRKQKQRPVPFHPCHQTTKGGRLLLSTEAEVISSGALTVLTVAPPFLLLASPQARCSIRPAGAMRSASHSWQAGTNLARVAASRIHTGHARERLQNVPSRSVRHVRRR